MENRITSPNSAERILNELSIEDRLLFEFSIMFSNHIIAKRKELGWSQEKLAERSGVNRVTIAKLEKKHRTVSIEVMLKLLHACGLGIQFVNEQCGTHEAF